MRNTDDERLGVAQPCAAAAFPSLIQRYLQEQWSMSAVDCFARMQESAGVSPPAEYSALMPASPPKPGEQYAFDVDLDACSGCKACVTACHALNGLDDDETWREVGLLHGGTTELPVMQHVTAACHHCLEPACMSACPVKAYEKDSATGIVRHLDDQCIGCQYCMLACPYDVPKYNHRLGIVRKCDMCSSRLRVGDAPACVQACPNGAIRITVVRQTDVLESCATGQFLPGAPDPAITLPTTNYRTHRAMPRNLLPADYYCVHPEHAHGSLIIMLVLTQLSVGAFLVAIVLQALVRPEVLAEVSRLHAIAALVFGLLALSASIFHLGRPHLAFRAVLGLKTSWLSREIVAFGVFALLAASYAFVAWFEPRYERHRWLGWAVASAGLTGVVCSIMIYRTTQRRSWSGSETSVKFLLTTTTLGISTMLVTSVVAAALMPGLKLVQVMAEYGTSLVRLLAAASAVKLLFEAAAFMHLRDKQNTLAKRSAILMTGPLRRSAAWRFVCGGSGGIVLPATLLAHGGSTGESNLHGPQIGTMVLALFALCVIGEILERYLFFTAVVAPRMPGLST